MRYKSPGYYWQIEQFSEFVHQFAINLSARNTRSGSPSSNAAWKLRTCSQRWTSTDRASQRTKRLPRASMPACAWNASASTGSWIRTMPAKRPKFGVTRASECATASICHLHAGAGHQASWPTQMRLADYSAASRWRRRFAATDRRCRSIDNPAAATSRSATASTRVSCSWKE